MKKILIISAFLIVLPFVGKSQLSIDSLVTSQNFTQDTVPYGTLINFNVKVLYGSATPFTGTIYLVSGVDSSAGVLSVDTIGFVNVLNLVNDSVLIPFNDTATNSNGYRVGGDIIVIWPIASGLIPVDTFRTDVWVLPLLTNNSPQNDKELFGKVSVFPNPLNNQLIIKKLSADLMIKKVRIYTMTGELIYYELYQQNIDVSNLTNGTYVLELELKNNQQLKFKIIK